MNHTALDSALKSNGFRALFNGCFVIKLCIKHSKPFSIPLVHLANAEERRKVEILQKCQYRCTTLTLLRKKVEH